MGTKEQAAALRSELKRRGWSGRAVSVRTDLFSMGSAIRVEVKDPAVPVHVVKALAEGHERIDRCPYSGDILSGGNRYVTVSVSEKCRGVKAAPYLEASRAACAAVDQADSSSSLFGIAGTKCSIGKAQNGWGYSLWNDGSHGFQGLDKPEHIARHVALYEEERNVPDPLQAAPESDEPGEGTGAPVDGAQVRENDERDGVEVMFSGKPAAFVRSQLKANGFRWSGRQGLWYAKRTARRLELARALVGSNN